jgi:hypothetical protein
MRSFQKWFHNKKRKWKMKKRKKKRLNSGIEKKNNKIIIETPISPKLKLFHLLIITMKYALVFHFHFHPTPLKGKKFQK